MPETLGTPHWHPVGGYRSIPPTMRQQYPAPWSHLWCALNQRRNLRMLRVPHSGAITLADALALYVFGRTIRIPDDETVIVNVDNCHAQNLALALSARAIRCNRAVSLFFPALCHPGGTLPLRSLERSLNTALMSSSFVVPVCNT